MAHPMLIFKSQNAPTPPTPSPFQGSSVLAHMRGCKESVGFSSHMGESAGLSHDWAYNEGGSKTYSESVCEAEELYNVSRIMSQFERNISCKPRCKLSTNPVLNQY